MTTLLQPFVFQTDQGLIPALVAESVQTILYADGWRVAVVNGEGIAILGGAYPEPYDAEQRAVEIALQYDITLILADDPTGEIADGLIEGALWRDELRDAETRWML